MKKTSYGDLKKKLVFKIPFSFAIALAVVIVLLCVGIGWNLTVSQKKMLDRQMQYLALNNANNVEAYLDTMQTLSHDLALDVERCANLDEKERDAFLRTTLDNLLDNDRIFSAYIALEPNVYFGNTPDGLSYYEYRNGSEKKLDVLNNYSEYKDGDYYATTAKTKQAHITEPYSYKLTNGETVWLVTISDPILDASGNFIGVSNADILTDTLNNLNYNNGDYKTSHNYIVTGANNYICDTADKSKSGTKYEDVSEKGRYYVTEPLSVSGVDVNWTSTFSVGSSEAMKDVWLLIIVVVVAGIVAIIVLTWFTFSLVKKSLAPIDDIVSLSRDMGEGKLRSDISVNTEDELGELAHIAENTSARLNAYVSDISDVLNKMSSGDFRAEITADYVGDFAPIKEALVSIVDSMNQTFDEIRTSASQISLGAAQVADGATALAQGSVVQASSVTELSATISSISNGVKDTADNAAEVNQSMEDIREKLEASNRDMEEMLVAMKRISDSSGQIGKIIQTIEDIAFQTNILALNAAVEAARAGNAGKGFAVVADEVRTLAAKSAEAAKNTTDLIQNSVQAVENGSAIATRTATSLSKAVQGVTVISEKIDNISDASNEQYEAIHQVTTGVEQISEVVQTNSATAEQSSAASEELSGQAHMMKKLIDRFHLRDV